MQKKNCQIIKKIMLRKESTILFVAHSLVINKNFAPTLSFFRFPRNESLMAKTTTHWLML